MNKLIIPVIIILAAFTRLIPHPPNFTPIIVIGLFGSAYIKNRTLAIMIPICAMFISDIFLGYHTTIFWVYGSLILISIIGIYLFTKINFKLCAIATLGSSLIFFIVTNFGVWMTSTFYPKTIYGILTCYIAALPFLYNTLLGSTFYAFIMFGGYEILKRNVYYINKNSIYN